MVTEDKFRWSFSQWETYNACPARWKYKSVLKLPTAGPGPAAARGLQIHSTVEDYVACRIDATGLHNAVSPKYLPVLDTFRNHPNGERWQEHKFSITEDWELAGRRLKTERGWCMMVLDAVRVGDAHTGPHATRDTPLVAYVGEWKSGKPKDTHGDQRKLYALGSLIHWPYVDKVEVTTYYLEDTEQPQRLTVTNSATARQKLQDLWKGRVDRMRSDKMCAPKPGMHCNWCDFAKKKGGPCVFGA